MDVVLITRESLAKDVEGRTREALLLEAADRFKYFFQDTNGDFEYPNCDPQIQQVLDIVAMSLCCD